MGVAFRIVVLGNTPSFGTKIPINRNRNIKLSAKWGILLIPFSFKKEPYIARVEKGKVFLSFVFAVG